MQQLHLVGFTTDLEGLIFSARRGAKSGSFVVPLDENLVSTIAEATRRRNGENEAPKEVRPPPPPEPEPRPPRPTSLLTPREIQARLRAGRSVEQVAKEAEVDVEWVDRFAPPVMAEQGRIVDSARQLVYAKPRRGESVEPLGRSVAWNLADKGVFLAPDEFNAAWNAYQSADRWVVQFRYRSRGRDHEAEWAVDGGDLVALNRTAGELGYIDRTRRRIRSEPDDHADPGRDPGPEEERASGLIVRSVSRRGTRVAGGQTSASPAAPPRRSSSGTVGQKLPKGNVGRAPARKATSKARQPARRSAPEASRNARPARGAGARPPTTSGKAAAVKPAAARATPAKATAGRSKKAAAPKGAAPRTGSKKSAKKSTASQGRTRTAKATATKSGGRKGPTAGRSSGPASAQPVHDPSGGAGESALRTEAAAAMLAAAPEQLPSTRFGTPGNTPVPAARRRRPSAGATSADPVVVPAPRRPRPPAAAATSTPRPGPAPDGQRAGAEPVAQRTDEPARSGTAVRQRRPPADAFAPPDPSMATAPGPPPDEGPSGSAEPASPEPPAERRGRLGARVLKRAKQRTSPADGASGAPAQDPSPAEPTADAGRETSGTPPRRAESANRDRPGTARATNRNSGDGRAGAANRQGGAKGGNTAGTARATNRDRNASPGARAAPTAPTAPSAPSATTAPSAPTAPSDTGDNGGRPGRPGGPERRSNRGSAPPATGPTPAVKRRKAVITAERAGDLVPQEASAAPQPAVAPTVRIVRRRRPLRPR